VYKDGGGCGGSGDTLRVAPAISFSWLFIFVAATFLTILDQTPHSFSHHHHHNYHHRHHQCLNPLYSRAAAYQYALQQGLCVGFSGKAWSKAA
jgi:hypothetical protein